MELIRNLPLLLHLFFWYFAVLRSLPSVRQSLSVGDMVFINNRGVYVPDPLAEPGLAPFAIAVAVALFVVYLVVRIGRDVAEKTGRRLPVVALSMVALVGIPGLAVLFHGAPLSFTTPVLKGFNFRDALVLTPEFATLIVALTVYHGAYAAEVIRSGIQSVPHGTVEAARSLALPKRHVFRFVVMPLAFRVIIPPMISRYLGLIKSSSLGVAVGYPEIVSIGNSIEYATGQSIELVILVMAFYLSISLTISIWLNWYNARVQLKSDR